MAACRLPPGVRAPSVHLVSFPLAGSPITLAPFSRPPVGHGARSSLRHHPPAQVGPGRGAGPWLTLWLPCCLPWLPACPSRGCARPPRLLRSLPSVSPPLQVLDVKSEMVGPERYRFKAEIGELSSICHASLQALRARPMLASCLICPRRALCLFSPPPPEFHGALIAARLLEGASVAGGEMNKVSRWHSLDAWTCGPVFAFIPRESLTF